jgi:hypothetical protein
VTPRPLVIHAQTTNHNHIRSWAGGLASVPAPPGSQLSLLSWESAINNVNVLKGPAFLRALHSGGPCTWDLTLCSCCLQLLTFLSLNLYFTMKSGWTVQHALGAWLEPQHCGVPPAATPSPPGKSFQAPALHMLGGAWVSPDSPPSQYHWCHPIPEVVISHVMGPRYSVGRLGLLICIMTSRAEVHGSHPCPGLAVLLRHSLVTHNLYSTVQTPGFWQTKQEGERKGEKKEKEGGRERGRKSSSSRYFLSF